ncbi:TetR family transcriptional regulator [Asanoa ferruginea]|uniref:TetR family transcriptional regulator n=1 Tax=Asanoa ferruginea TaxID=53367 RepID=A0A3D9ZBU8_9ACTN|nr:GntR family transcriptional regulator [Asanoa ferruginea]REF94868.1 TetR family transcriptional regulator [Asanoa ferruginea]GIF45553.1 GntR family transcriptional regulator [Asanoa ferruginea]
MAQEAPYRRIAAEIRERIARGDLGPGDRIPSTREITRDWGVAMATATKVINTLREAGLVETRSGAGSVVIERSGPGVDTVVEHGISARAGGFHGSATPRLRRSGDTELTRERIVRSAIAIADAEGLSMLTMRRVAADLGVATMSLYRHVPGKDELILAMLDAVFGDDPLPAEPPPQWRVRLETAARHMWRSFATHPWAAESLSLTRPQFLPNLLSYSEWSLDSLRALGFNADEMMHIHLSLFGHVRATALSLDAELQAREDTGVTNDEWADSHGGEIEAVLNSRPERLAGLRYVAEQGFDYDIEAVFESGLRLMLDGVAVALARREVSGDDQVDVSVL